MGRRRLLSPLRQFAKAVERNPEWALTWAGPASESLALRRRAGELPGWSSSLAARARKEPRVLLAEDCLLARLQRVGSVDSPAAGVAGAVPKEFVRGAELEGRSATVLQAHDSRERSGPPVGRSPMAGATEMRGALVRELRNSQVVQKPSASRVPAQLGAAHFSQPELVLLPPPPTVAEVAAWALLRDSPLVLRRPFPPRAGGDSAPHRRRANWSASSCL